MNTHYIFCQANLGTLSATVWVFLTSQFGQDDRLHNSRQQADISIPSLQNVVLLKAVKQQGLEPEHVLEICTLSLEEWGKKDIRESEFIIHI